MTSHEILINILGSTVLNIIPIPSTPIAPSGVLRGRFGYTIRLPKFGETIRDLMRRKGAKVPDLLLVNEDKKLFIAVECKGDFTFEMEERLSNQIEFYSSDDFRKMWQEMFPGLKDYEIWIVSYTELGKKIVEFVERQEGLSNLANIVVWEVELRKTREEAHIQKIYGSHHDKILNEHMEAGGLVCSPPRTELLVDPTLTYGERVFRIGRRILSFMASSYITEKERIVTISDFRERYPDVVMSDRELKRCLRYLMNIVPQIGEYNSGTGEVVLAKKPSLDKIKAKLEKIQEMGEKELKIELAILSKKVGRVRVKRKKEERIKLDEWFPKSNQLSMNSSPGYVDNIHSHLVLYSLLRDSL